MENNKNQQEACGYNPAEESPVVFIDRIVDIDTGKEIPTDHFGDKILEMIGQTPVADIEALDEPNHSIAHRKDIGIDIYYSVGFMPAEG